MYGYGYGYYSMFDPTMILVLIGVFLSLGASAKVKSTYARFSRVRSMTGMTGAEAARQLLNSQGIYDVQIRQVAGSLTDHYDPRTKTVNLSESVYGSTSVAAIGVARVSLISVSVMRRVMTKHLRLLSRLYPARFLRQPSRVLPTLSSTFPATSA